jgi:hypothetical protein
LSQKTNHFRRREKEAAMPFEKFIPPDRQRPPQVSIKRTGTITFYKSWMAAHGLGKASHVVLFFDPAKKLVGVKSARDGKEEGAMKLTHRKRVSSVRARSFFERYRIKLEHTTRYPVSHDRVAAMAIIDLRQAKRRPGRRRRNA